MFAFFYSKFADPGLRDIRRLTPEFAGMTAGDSALDVCCGTGDQALHYARRGINATGIDLNPDMIKIARNNQRRLGLSNASFQIADATNLPFPDNSFDYASISLALHEKERPARSKIVAEMKRVVKKESALIFIDYQVPRPKNLYAYFIKALEFMVGREHFRCFADYVEQGGLDVILKNNQLNEEKRDYLKNGVITLIKTRNT